MGFINKKIHGVPRGKSKHVQVRRGYYTFSRYYPAGDSNRVYRKSISRAKREKNARAALLIVGSLLFVALVFLLIFM